MPKITIKRSSNWFWMVRKLNVRINEEEVGQIGNGETKTFEVELGENTIFTHLKGGKSEELKVDVQENQNIKLVVSPSQFDVVATIATIIIIPILVVFTGPYFYLNYIYYLISSVLILIVFSVRSILKITAFELRKS